MTFSRAMVNMICDVIFVNLDIYDPPESGR